jgi:hypothetical protein
MTGDETVDSMAEIWVVQMVDCLVEMTVIRTVAVLGDAMVALMVVDLADD